MYRLKMGVIAVFVLLTFISNVRAEENISLSCNQSEDSVVCELVGNAKNYEVVAIEGKVALSENLKINRFKNNKIWNGDLQNSTISLYGIGVLGDNSFDIGTLTLKIINANKDFGEVFLNEFRYADSNYKWHYLDNTSLKVDIKNNAKIEENKKINNTSISFLLIIDIILLLILISFIVLFIKCCKEKTKVFISWKLLIIIFVTIVLSITSCIFYINRKKLEFLKIKKNYLEYECIEKQDTIDCSLYGYSNYSIIGIEFNVHSDNNLFNFVPYSNWQGDYFDNKIALISDKAIKKKFKIGDFIFYKENEISKVYFNNIKYISENGNNYNLKNFYLEVYKNEKQ